MIGKEESLLPFLIRNNLRKGSTIEETDVQKIKVFDFSLIVNGEITIYTHFLMFPGHRYWHEAKLCSVWTFEPQADVA